MSFRQKIKTFREKVSRWPKPVRIIVGILFVLSGLVGFLPILGFWMVPLGLLILAVDIPMARRIRRRLEIRLGRWLVRASPKWARRFGFSVGERAA